MSVPRIAILGLHLEVNAFSPPTTRRDFQQQSWAEGEAITTQARAPTSALPAEIPGFYARMDATGDWEPVPLILITAPPGGTMAPGIFPEFLEIIQAGLAAAGRIDGVYVASHGASRAAEEDDTDGAVLQLLRDLLGPDVPIVGTLDLHCNVSDRQVALADLLIAYRTNPHVDMRERAAEAADALRRILETGERPETHFIRLPLTPPTVTLLTAEDSPYAEAIRAGVLAREEDPNLLGVSVTGGFVYTDIAKCGLCVWASARPGHVGAAVDVAERLSNGIWQQREALARILTPIEDAVAAAVAAGTDPATPRLILADVADNPGGGGGGNTTALLAALHAAGAQGVVFGILVDPELAAAAHAAGQGARIEAVANATPGPFAETFAAPAQVRALSDGTGIGRRGTLAGRAFSIGPAALLELEGSGLLLAVGSLRRQLLDPAMLEILGVEVAAARTIVVKSRGHFRAGFDIYATPDRILEVDAPGLVSPVLSRFDFRGLPRPVYPLDAEAAWG
ncbi:M81 family metallopeptidase [Falsiroseomonas sp.]|uniref:M81 family metallopeptidase n=1 Tax=Falsiroseomonas sp. TaxID=2870721 RepID=UPI003F6F8BFF